MYMKRLLVGIVLKELTQKTKGVTLVVPDAYDPANDSPDAEDAYPILREKVYERVKEIRGISPSEYTRFVPEKTEIISISELGKVKANDSDIDIVIDELSEESIYDTMDSTKRKLVAMTYDFCDFDFDKKNTFIVLLVHYLKIKYRTVNLITKDDQKFVEAYNSVMQAYRLYLHAYGTEEYKKTWEHAWDGGQVRYILESEGFI